MPEPILVLRLEGPLQSWGERARWDVRDSLREPTKSAVIGLLGAALGVRRTDRASLHSLDRTLRFGVRVEHEGTALEDFHTVTGLLPKAEGGRPKEGTIISQRRYLADAAFLVMLVSHPADRGKTVERCAQALRAPYWPLFLGRRSCPPTRPVLVEVTSDYESLEAALAGYPWSWQGEGGTPRARPIDVSGRADGLRVVIDDEGGEFQRQDVIELNEVRLYERRRVREFRVTWPGEA